MSGSKTYAAAIAAIAALTAAAPALAANDAMVPASHATTETRAHTSIYAAIEAAEQKTGGRAIQADIENEDGHRTYQIRTASKDAVFDAVVDPATGQVSRIESEGLFARLFAPLFDREDEGAFAKMSRGPMTLVTAMSLAEQKVGGHATEARYDSDGEPASFHVEIVRDKTTRKVRIDGFSGKVLAVTSEDDSDED